MLELREKHLEVVSDRAKLAAAIERLEEERRAELQRALAELRDELETRGRDDAERVKLESESCVSQPRYWWVGDFLWRHCHKRKSPEFRIWCQTEKSLCWFPLVAEAGLIAGEERLNRMIDEVRLLEAEKRDNVLQQEREKVAALEASVQTLKIVSVVSLSFSLRTFGHKCDPFGKYEHDP